MKTRYLGILLALPTLLYGWERPVPKPAPLERPDSATVCIIGDLMMHRGQIEEGHWDESLRLIAPLLENATVSIANMEFTIAGEPYTGYPCFSAPDGYALTAARSGVDVFLTANNHILDKGAKGWRRTMEVYSRLRDSLGIFSTGCDGLESPLYIRADNIRIALVNATYGTNCGAEGTVVNRLSDKKKLLGAVREGAERADFCIVLPHWGEEYKLHHNAAQEALAREMALAGADLIVGAHPHVVQDTASIFVAEQRDEGNDTSSIFVAGQRDGAKQVGTDSTALDPKGPQPRSRRVPVVYSLGNALSNMSAPNTQLEFLARLTLVRDRCGTRLTSLELIPLWCSRPGGFDSHYTVIPIAEYAGKRELWKNPADYDKMMATLKRLCPNFPEAAR